MGVVAARVSDVFRPGTVRDDVILPDPERVHVRPVEEGFSAPRPSGEAGDARFPHSFPDLETEVA